MKALRTLVVEDDAMIGGLLAETLEGLGHTVCAVESNLANMVAAASHWRPDLMIVDVGLGEASGIAAVKEILGSGFVPLVFVMGDALGSSSPGPDTILIRKPFRVDGEPSSEGWSGRFVHRPTKSRPIGARRARLSKVVCSGKKRLFHRRIARSLTPSRLVLQHSGKRPDRT